MYFYKLALDYNQAGGVNKNFFYGNGGNNGMPKSGNLPNQQMGMQPQNMMQQARDNSNAMNIAIQQQKPPEPPKPAEMPNPMANNGGNGGVKFDMNSYRQALSDTAGNNSGLRDAMYRISSMESGNFKHMVGGYNLGGIKANNDALKNGNYVNAMTNEEESGKMKRVSQSFRTFNTAQEFTNYQAQTLQNIARKNGFDTSKLNTAQDWINAVSKGKTRYATDSNWGSKVMSMKGF